MSMKSNAQLLLESEFFDSEFYAYEHDLNFEDDVAAARHYLAKGWRLGLSPSRLFDLNYYLQHYADVREAGDEPLIHFLKHGRKEGRKPRLGVGRRMLKPRAPSHWEWEALAEVRRASSNSFEDAQVVVIVPVYRGFHDTLACLYSVLKAQNRSAYRLLVVNDASPDPALVQELEEIARLGLIELTHNPGNLGFVRTVNRGMSLANESDVVLLNSDTIVYGNWIDRLRAHVLADESIATVTPMSNNATIVSYPYFDKNNNVELEIPGGDLDRVFADVNKSERVDLPTGVGFCFYIRRRCIDEIGSFDAELFGRGYGEENDFCLRAAAAGWRNVAAVDVYVQHTGEVSFSTGAQADKAEGLRRLIERHPLYLASVKDFVENDPLAEFRGRVDVARAARLAGRRATLFVEHGWGGGISRHINDLAGRLQKEGWAVFCGRPGSTSSSMTLSTLPEMDLPNLPSIDVADPEEGRGTLEKIGIQHIHVHSMVGYKVRDLHLFSEFFNASVGGYDLTIHDYAPICPRVHMVDWGGSYCESPSVEYCQICVGKAGTPFGAVDARAWREVYAAFMRGARRIFVPDQDVAERLGNFDPELPDVLVRPHPEFIDLGQRPARLNQGRTDVGRVKRVGVLGAIGPHKGSLVLLCLAADALRRKLPLHFVLLGYSDQRQIGDFPNVEVSGAYDEAEVDELLEAANCDFVLLPSVWPETFSYTLSIAFRNGAYPVVFDFGAPARRIREAGFGEVLPPDLIYAPSEMNDRLLAITPKSAPASLGASLDGDRLWRSREWYYDLE